MKTFKEFLNEAKSELYDDLRTWKYNAEYKGFKVSSPVVDREGEVNKGQWFVAKDKQGNFRGEFDTRKGRKGEGYFI